MTVIDVSNAPSILMSMSGIGDNGTRYGSGRNQPGKCTRWQWLAVGGGAGFENTSPLPSAVAAWENAPAEHRHSLDEVPFRGAIFVYGASSGPRWKGDENWPYGDVAMVTGTRLTPTWRDWDLGATDAAGVGRIAVVNAGTRYAQTGYRKPLGWLSSFGGAVLSPGGGAGAPITDTVTPTVPEEDDMAFKPLVAKTLIGQGPGTDTWIFDFNDRTYRHARSTTEIALAAKLGAVVLDGPQPKDLFRGFKYIDIDGKGIR